MENRMTPYSLERHLEALCRQDAAYENLWATWSLNKRSCAEGLKNIAQDFPHYSQHDDRHSETILSNMEMLLGERRVAVLSPTDAWLLLQAAYLHDFGMAQLYKRLEMEWATEDFQDYLRELREAFDPALREAAEYLAALGAQLGKPDFEKNWPLKVRRYTTQVVAGYFRGTHAQQSAQYIEHMKDWWHIDLTHNGLIPERLIRLVGQVSSLHTRDPKAVLALDYCTNGFGADYAHPRFIAEMLRLGDLLDADNGRFSEAAELATGELPVDSKRHRGKHEATRHILITPQQIEYRADCGSAAVYREARSFLTWLESELTFAAVHWAELVPEAVGGSAPRLTKRELLLNGKRDLDNTSDLRFFISQERAFDIIEGANLYESNLAFLRELIQNAEDASKVQLWRDLRAKQYEAWLPETFSLTALQPYDLPEQCFGNYPILVDLADLENGDLEISITDRGTGMTIETFRQMCDVGGSFRADKRRRREIEEMPAWLRPTSGFGIGLQSIFLEAPSFEIDSRAEGRALHATVESRKREGYVQIEEGGEPEVNGTRVRVRVRFKEDISIQFRGATASYLREEYDPFGTRDERLLWLIVEELCEFCPASLFPIAIRHNGKQLQDLDRIHLKRFDLADDAAQEEGDFRYVLAEHCRSMRLWKKTESFYAELAFEEMRHSETHFKGKAVDHEIERESQYVSSLFDFYGLDTKEYLTLDRKGFRAEQMDRIASLTRQSIRFFVDKAVERILKAPPEAWWLPQEAVEMRAHSFPFVVWSSSSAEQQRQLYEQQADFLRQMWETVDVLCPRQEEGRITYRVEKKSMFLLIEALFSGDGFCYVNAERDTQIEEQLIAQCAAMADTLPQQELVILDYQQGARNAFHRYGISHCWCRRTDLRIYKISREPTEAYQVDALTRKNELASIKQGRGLFYRSARRSFMPMEKDRELLVNGRLISPVLVSDEQARAGMSEDAFVERITTRADFARLVEHVCKERYPEDPAAAERVRAGYTAWIREYYQTMRDVDAEEPAETKA